MSHQSDILMIHPFLFYLFLPFPDNAVQQFLAYFFNFRYKTGPITAPTIFPNDIIDATVPACDLENP